MSEKTLVPQSQSGAKTFLFREDFLLFGMLVRHGLCEPGDYVALVEAQHQQPQMKPLIDLLANANALEGRRRADIDELMRVLATPKLRELLPAELPEVKTIVRALEATVRLTDPDATVKDGATAVTVRPAAGAEAVTVRGDADDLVAAEVTRSLTAEEMQRVTISRFKGRLIGQTLSGHIILDRIGSGGQGDVYLAKQVSLNRYVALKKLEVPTGALPKEFIAMFRREAETLARINHSRIVKIFDIFEDSGSAYFTMEHIDGRTLRQLIDGAEGPLPVDVVANLACQACSALSRTSGLGLIHRDIKPANMMVDENGDLKIVDFGLAAAAASMKGNEGFGGTPAYASPEQCMMQPLSAASDQYSLGVTLYHALTGRTPFENMKLTDLLDAHVNAQPARPSAYNAQLPPAVDQVLMRMMAKNPADRFASFDECFATWERVLNNSARTMAGAPQLLGESLLRVGRDERRRLVTSGAILCGLWVAMAAGSILGERMLRPRGMAWVLDAAGVWGTALLAFSLSCIFYVAMARKGMLPVFGSLRAWLMVHIATAIPSVLLILLHSGNFLGGILPGGQTAKPVLSIIVALALIVTAASGSVGLLIFRTLRRQLQIQELQLRGSALSRRDAMFMVLGAQLLSGWRLVHYPLAVLFVLLSILHVLVFLRFGGGG